MTEWSFERVPGTGPLHPVLTVSRASDFASELSFTASSGRSVSALLKPRYTRLLLSLVAAWHADADRGTAWRGWRTRHELGKAFGAMPLADGPVEGDTVKHYVSAIRRSIRQAVRTVGARPDPTEFIATRRSVGYRIGQLGLTVAWEDAGPHDDADVHASRPLAVPDGARRGAPILVHFAIHRTIEAGAPSSGSKGASS